MLLEDILLVAATAIVLWFVGRVVIRIGKALWARRRNPIEEARERLRVAEQETEAAQLNKKADDLYEHLYEETLSEEEDKDHHGQG